MDDPTKNRVVLVTGAARRVGAAIVRTVHAAGWNVSMHYRSSAQDACSLAAELNDARPGSALLLQGDLGEVDVCGRLVEATRAHFGRLDGIVNNASSFFATPLDQVTPEAWDTLFATNARAPVFLAQAAADSLRERAGAIVNLVDIYGERPLPGHMIYCMAKASLVMATQSLARELGPRVRVNGVAPGNVLWSDNPVKAETLETVRSRTALARQGHPDNIAEAVRWLLQDAEYVTGQIVAVDGGRRLFI